MNRLLPILLLLCGCAASAPVNSAPRRMVAGGNEQVIVAEPVIYHRAVAWDYPDAMPVDNVAFDVEGSTNLSDWYLIFTTNQPPASFDSLQPIEMIRVGAHWIIDP